MTLEPADAAFSLDDAPVTLPVNGDIYVEPGDHRASITRAGYQPNQQTLHVSKGGARVLWIRLDPAPGTAAAAGASTPPAEPASNPPSAFPRESSNRPSSADREPASSRSLVPVIVGGGIAVAGIATGVGFLLSGNSHGNKADALANDISAQNGCSTGTPYADDCARLHSENQSGASARRLETVSFTVAGAAAVAVIAYLLWPHSDGRMRSRGAGSAAFGAVTPTFEIDRGLGTAGIRGRF